MSVIKRLSLYEFTLMGPRFSLVVLSVSDRGIFFFFFLIYENFVGTLETVRYREESFNIRQVSVFLRDSTVIKTPPS